MKKSGEKADIIIAATSRLLKNKRYYEVTLDEIAAEAQVGKGTIYRYFTDKDDLMVKLSRAIVVRLTEVSQAAITSRMGLKEKLTGIAQASYAYLLANPGIIKIVNEEREIFMKQTHAIETGLYPRPFFAFLRTVFEAGIDSGELDTDLDLFFIITTFAALVRGVAQVNFFMPGQGIDFDQVVDVFFKGISK